MQESKFILTFDVGIKNLAYCIVKYDAKDKVSMNSNNFCVNKKFNLLEKIDILNWDIIDVSYKALYCKEIKNKRAICNCISKYYSLIDNNISHSDTSNLIGYCKNHAKIIQNDNKKNKKNGNNIKLFKICNNPIYTNNFNYQMDRLISALIIFYNKIILSPYIIINNKPEFIRNLDIYIENQPVLKNPIMKSISIAIYTFFTLKKFTEPSIINSINFINATVKTKDVFITKIYDVLNIKSNIVKFKNYDNRKNFTIDVTNKIINKISNNINNIISSSNYILIKKKDDLADTLIYVIYVIFFIL